MNIATASVRAARIVKWMDTIYTINVGKYQSGGIVGVFESTVPRAADRQCMCTTMRTRLSM
jgi:hypothetical protein